MENHIKMDDLGVPLFLETPIYIYICRESEIPKQEKPLTLATRYRLHPGVDGGGWIQR